MNYSLIFLLVLILAGGFVKFITVLNIFRFGLGLKDWTFGIVIFCVSLVLSLVVLNQVLVSVGGVDQIIQLESMQGVEPIIKQFLDKNTDPALAELIGKGALIQGVNAEHLFSKLLGFLISDLKTAFMYGLIIILPFVLIDLIILVTTALIDLRSMDMQTLSLPLKLLLFYFVDGWLLVIQKILFYNI